MTQNATADRVSSGAKTKPAIDWSARNRVTSVEVQRYSRFVVIMKRALPLAALALIAAVVAYSLQPRLQDGRKLSIIFQKLHITNDLMMSSPRLTGEDSQGNPYVVTAERAVQDLKNRKHARLEKVEADITLKKGDWINLTGAQGWLDMAEQKLWLWGVIDVFSDNGYEMHTSAADIDMLTGTVVGKKFVSGQGPLGTFYADKFKIDRGVARDKKHGARPTPKAAAKSEKTVIYLYGNVHMTIYKQAHR